MADIQVYQRNQLPPGRAGLAKPPYQLADQRGLIQAGQALAKFGGDTFDRLIKSRANNEISEFLGTVNSEQEKFEGYIRANPGAGFENMQKERDKMIAAIGTTGEKLTTGIGKRWTTNWLAENKKLLYEKSQSTMEAIVSGHELKRMNFSIDAAIADRDIKKVNHIIDSMSGINPETGEQTGDKLLIDRELAPLLKEQYALEINELIKKDAKSIILGVAQSFRDENGEIDLKAGQDYIKKSELSAKFKLEVLRDLNFWNAQEQQALDQQREVDRGEIYDAIDKGVAPEPYGMDMRGYIESFKSLDQDEQEKLWELARKPTVETNYERYDEIRTMIDEVGQGTRKAEDVQQEIKKSVGKDFDVSVAKSLREKLSQKQKVDSVLNRPVVKRALKILNDVQKVEIDSKGAYPAKEEIEDRNKWFGIKNDFERWLIENPDATDEEIEKKTERITTPARKEITLNIFERSLLLKGRGQLFGLVGTEQERLVNKKIDALKDEGVWDDLNEQEKESARQRLMRGETVQNILDLLE